MKNRTRRSFLETTAISAPLAVLAGCTGDGDGTGNGGGSSGEDDPDIPDDPADASEEYIYRFYDGDVNWVNEFRADDGEEAPITEADAEDLEPVDVTIHRLDVVEEDGDTAVVRTTIDAVTEDSTTRFTLRFTLRRIDGEWRLWRSEEIQVGVNILDVDFQRYQGNSGLTAVTTIKNNTDERLTVNVVVEVYEDDLLIDDGSAWPEVPGGAKVEAESHLFDVEDVDRITHFIVRAQIGYGGELTKITEGTGEMLRKDLDGE